MFYYTRKDRMKFIYDPPADRFVPGFKVGQEYEGNYENNPCFRKVQEAKKTKTKKVDD